MYRYALRDNDLMLDFQPDDINLVKQYILKIRDRHDEDTPFDQIVQEGPAALSTAQLVSIIFGTGTSAEDALPMAARVTHDYGEHTFITHTNVKQLAYELRIPLLQAAQLVACGELGRRFWQKRDGQAAVIRTARDVFNHVQEMRQLPKEHLRGLYLNMHYQVIHDEVLSIGTLTSNLIHPREVFKPAIEYNAAAVVLVHNHPSGIAKPSKADISITNQLINVGHMLGINLIDHVIVTKDTFNSIDLHYDESI